jgi:RHS repeat-associated protein
MKNYKAQGFNQIANPASTQNTYDAEGNMTYAHAKGANIAYNYLNLPTMITFQDGSKILNSYNAAGVKLTSVKQAANNTIVSTQNYLGGVEYKTIGSTHYLEALYNKEGRVYNTSVNTGTTNITLQYEFTIKDHLGNARITYSDKNNNGQVEVPSEIIQENHYYPFGMNMNGPWMNSNTDNDNPYQYNGKELEAFGGLNWNDYGARWYDPAVGRFTTVDPLAGKYPSWSPYNYTLNNPIRYIDPDGRSATDPPYGRVVGIFFHGGPTGGGKTTTPAKAGGTGDFYNSTKAYANEAGRDFVGTVIAPGLTSASGVENAMCFINDNLQDGDQLVVYGYSYGVDVAVDFATALEELGVDVDLLITVDGSDGPLQNSTVNTTIPSNVSTNLNVYQTDDSGSSSSSRSTGATSSNSSSGSSSSNSGTSNSPGSNGGPNRAANSRATKVINRNVTAPGTTHGNIQSKEKEVINNTIKKHIQGN